MLKPHLQILVCACVVVVVATTACTSRGISLPEPPRPARVTNVVETEYGITLSDPYRWMEAPGNGAEVNAWYAEQNAYAETLLSGIPGHARLRDRVLALSKERDVVDRVVNAGDQLFFLERRVGDNAARLVRRDASGNRMVLMDPNNHPVADATTAITAFSVSPDSETVAINLTRGGSELTTIHFMDVTSGELLPDRIPDVWGEFPAIWDTGSRRVYYTQMNRAAMEDPAIDDLLNMQAWQHVLGTDTGDSIELSRASIESERLPPEAFPIMHAPNDSPWKILISAGARHEYQVFTAATDAGASQWQELIRIEDGVTSLGQRHDTLYLLDKRTPMESRVLALRLGDARPRFVDARLLATTTDFDVSQLFAARDALYMVGTREGTSHLLRMDYETGKTSKLPLPSSGAVSDVSADSSRSGVTFCLATWAKPVEYFRYDPETGVQPLALAPAETDTVDIRVSRITGASKDGTRIPVTVLHRADLPLDGKRPTILHGYGAYQYTYEPHYNPASQAWLERGNVIAYAHVRGGGFHGRSWYLAGKGANKPNGIADFIAAAEALVSSGYTNPRHLAAHGSSMAGALVGPAIIERPDLFAAATLSAASLNNVRYLEGINGANQTMEFGNPQGESGLRMLLAMDAYQKLEADIAYPSTMLMIGLNDNRVSPWISAKFGARLAATSTTELPLLVRTDGDRGHGMHAGVQQRAAWTADNWSFLLNRMGDPEFQFQAP